MSQTSREKYVSVNKPKSVESPKRIHRKSLPEIFFDNLLNQNEDFKENIQIVRGGDEDLINKNEEDQIFSYHEEKLRVEGL